jgi:N-acetylmuramoyl-L-alanine amidase
VKVVLVAVLAFLATSAPAGATPTICIDPGHERTPDLSTEPIGPGSSIYKIKDGGGAPGEATVVLGVGLKLRKVLLNLGYQVAMTRTTMNFDLGNGGNIARAKFCNNHHARLMVRVHADGSTDPSRHGASTLYPAWHKGWTGDILPQSRLAAWLMQRKYVKWTHAANLGTVKRGDLTGFNWAHVPAVLVETGFMTNPTEGAKLRTNRYQWHVAHALAAGVRAFVGLP